MAPIPRLNVVPLSVRSSNSLSATDTNEPIDIATNTQNPPSPFSSTPMISLIITTIVLSILVAGACYYLSKLLWKRYIIPKREKRRIRRLLREKEKACEAIEVYFGDSAGLGSHIDPDAQDQKGNEQKDPQSPADHNRTAASKTTTKAKKGRTNSDELWSTTLDHETSLSSPSDEEEPPHHASSGRLGPYDSPSHHHQQEQQQQCHQYGIARGSGYGPVPNPQSSPLMPPPLGKRRQATSLSSVSSLSTTSSSILYVASLGTPVVAGTARVVKGEAVTVDVGGNGNVKRRSRFFSFGAGGGGGRGGAVGRSPLIMHPVREGDLVDVPFLGAGGRGERV